MKRIMKDNFLMHYGRSKKDGAPVGSGRYPLGSGDDPYQRSLDFVDQYKRYKVKGFTKKEIAEKLNVVDKYGRPTAGALDARLSNEKEAIKVHDIALARQLASEGKGNTEIGRILGKPEGTIRGWLDETKQMNAGSKRQIANALKEMVNEKRYIDVSNGAETYLDNCTHNKLQNVCEMLRHEGYNVWTVKIPQLGTNHMTTITALTAPDCTYGELYENRFNIRPIYKESLTFDQDGVLSSVGLAKDKIHNIDPKRITIRYNEEGGLDRDGLIELRPGVDDISIGANRYAQVRIPVDGTHYIKGMAVYNSDLPPGVDIRFNTNKHLGTPMIGDKDNEVLKRMKTTPDGSIDWDNPFGAAVKQLTYDGADGKKHYSAANIVNEEGQWQAWDRNLPSQFGSKQPEKLIKRQLDLDVADRKAEYDAINSLTNPTIKKKLLIEFADKCDTAAIDLKAAAFPGQQTHVLLPSPKIKAGEIYAPNYEDGTHVVLIRYPHAGTFEIPELVVRNKGSIGKKMIGANAPDAVVINHKTAAQLSGADFDGDTAAVIPLSDKVRVNHKDSLEGLKDFDPSESYPKYKGMQVISAKNKQRQMGEVTNLITDMTLKGANEDDIVKAVKHSMVIIDAEKHELNWKQSEKDNEIARLKKLYQDDGSGHTGAGTIISRAKSPTTVEERREWFPSSTNIDPETGKKVYDNLKTGGTYEKVKLVGKKVPNPETGRAKTVYPDEADSSGWIGTYKDKTTGKLYYNRENETTGKKERVYLNEGDYTARKTVGKTTEIKKMAKAEDAYELTSGGSRENYGYRMEKVYADYANSCKALANTARKSWLNTKEEKADPSAQRKYKAEVTSLEAKLRIAESNAPRERQAQMMGNRNMERIKTEQPEIKDDKDKLGKYRAHEIQKARDTLGIKRADTLINITDNEWEAIQNHAISPNKLSRILQNTNPDKLRDRATPKNRKTISTSQKSLAKQMANSGFTNEQIAKRLGISTTSVYTIISGKERDK